MKNLILLILMTFNIPLVLSAQQDIEHKFLEPLEETSKTSKSVDEITDIGELLVYYFKEAAEGSKNIVGSSIEIAEKAVNTLIKESTIIVSQFLIFTGVKYFLFIMGGLFLIYLLPKQLIKKFSISENEAIEHNNSIDESDDFYKEDKKPKAFGYYYNSWISYFSVIFFNYVFKIIGLIIIVFCILPFIKVVFFSKLYLVELLIKYI